MKGKWTTAILLIILSSLILTIFPIAAGGESMPEPEQTKFTITYCEKSLTAGVAHALAQTKDGGYVLAGGISTHSGAQVIKIDSRGREEWRTTWDGLAYSVIQTADGGFAVAAPSQKSSLVKLDSNGKIEWKKDYNLWGNRAVVVQVEDQGYVIAGADFKLIKTDSSGETQWSKTLQSDQKTQTFKAIARTQDGGFILAGNKNDRGWLVKTDAEGNMEWNKTLIGDNTIHSIVQTSNGGYTIAGAAGPAEAINFTRTGVWVVHVNFDGEISWEKEFEDVLGNFARGFVQIKDGGYAIVGPDSPSPRGCWLIKITENGGFKWYKYFQTEYATWMAAWALVQTNDGGFAFTGSSFFLVKTDSEGNTTPEVKRSSFGTIMGGSTIVDTSNINGIKLAVTNSSLPDHMNIVVTTNIIEAAPPLWANNLPVNGVAFYEVKVSSDKSLGPNSMATISITNPLFNLENSILVYWHGQSWVKAQSSFESPHTVSGIVPVSDLLDTTRIAITNETIIPAPSPNSSPSQHQIDVQDNSQSIVIVVAVVAAIILAVVSAALLFKKRKNYLTQ